MRRRGPEEEACGVWLDAAALKRRKVQTHVMKPNTKMLTLFPGEKKAKISFTQRIAPAGIRQTSIASFFTLQPGRTIGGDQRNVSSPIESQTNKESKNDVTQLDHLIQGLGDDCMAPPLATSTPADTQEAGLSPQPLQDSGHHRMGTPFLTVLSLLQPDTLVCAAKSKASPSCSFTKNLEGSRSLDQKEEEKDSSWKREWLHGSKKKNYQGVERPIKPPRGKGHEPLDKTPLEKVSAKETRQTPILLQTYRDSWKGENTHSVKQSPCPIPLFSWDSEKNDKDSWSQLFTEDSQGQRVIAHNSRAPFQDVTNNQNRGLGQFSSSRWAQCQETPTQLNLQPDLLFTQDSEGSHLNTCVLAEMLSTRWQFRMLQVCYLKRLNQPLGGKCASCKMELL
ncbi:aurora kinase A and ninein-interacting protein [Lynx rufus]|uniref:aurora kinase A and ninein-interacting protein n=1 Tax=Lynx rufus TaxID=61384 RepID=UPI001F125922|nr:aurora kinase A and ninein-interacting protein [Lynx rufus]